MLNEKLDEVASLLRSEQDRVVRVIILERRAGERQLETHKRESPSEGQFERGHFRADGAQGRANKERSDHQRGEEQGYVRAFLLAIPTGS